jgi:lipopolysaccharide/colanic/teichoic acid biosynthesis glycosyltransferase
MKVMGFTSLKKLFGTRKSVQTINGIYPQCVFQKLVERERNRVDRNGSEFSIIALQAAGIFAHRHGKEHVVETLKDRMRATDDMGWFDSKRIGLLLPDTPGRGAETMAAEITHFMGREGITPKLVIYTYPSHWPFEPSYPIKRGCEREKAGSDAYESRLLDGGGSTIQYKSLGPVMAYRLPGWKRVFDIVGATLGLFLLSPVLLAIACIIWVVSPGPVIFRQERVGCGGGKFCCLKFRTMRRDAEAGLHENYVAGLISGGDIPMQKLDEDDDRIIPFGSFLRKTALDELPQLINVLKGEMSLIGPRPCIVNEAVEYRSWQKRRFDTHPGLTGLWQVSGKNRTTFKQMIRLDVNYAKSRSLWLDMKILFKTIPVIFLQSIGKH